MPRFRLLTDAHIRQQLVDGLQQRGWDVERAIDVFPEGTDDDILFEYAAKNNRVFVTCDKRLQLIAYQWLDEERPFRMITWKQEHHRRLSEGWFIEKFEELAEVEDPFDFAIRHLNPD